jgi:predicted NACHT family NTPase
VTLSSIIANAAGTFAIKTADRALDKASEKIVKSFGDYAVSTRDKIVAEFRIGFQTFMQNSYERCRTYKTLLNPYVPLPVLDKYIHIKVEIGGKTFTDQKLIAGIRSNTRVIITGLAGSGKSMLMKYLTLTLSDAGPSLLPLFIELRRFNSEPKKDLKSLILAAMSNDLSKVTDEQFKIGLKSGAFALILDGFDELNEEIAESIEKEIIEFSNFHPNVALVVSSRPSRRFEAWEKFYSARVMPLDIEQTQGLIDSFEYDAGVKSRFLSRVEEGLWKTHESFLSSPLLCTIMMLTFEEFAEIPTKMHAFYGQAFDTLFQRHDALKYQFTRETKTKMTKDLLKGAYQHFV